MSTELKNQAYKFLEKVFPLLEDKKINIRGWKIDHACYRTTSMENYDEMKKQFGAFCELLAESEVNGRNIATYKLDEPIFFRGFKVKVVEVPAPKKGKETKEGFEHIEVVIDIPFEKLIKQNPKVEFDTSSIEEEPYPEVVVKFDDCCVKFHHKSLEEIIEEEQES